MARFQFLVDTYSTERLKTLSVWSQIPDERLRFRPEPRARSPLEHMVHQCLSEDAWMRTMLDIGIAGSPLPSLETRLAFLERYAACSAERLVQLSRQPDHWFEGDTKFFEVVRSRAWVLTRRFTHSAHHRGQLTVYLRLWGQALYSTYGPTADTGGFAQNGAEVIYPYDSVEDLLAKESRGARPTVLSKSATAPVTERP
jgi:uncharacterized damage-inducible protein DinB